MRFHKTPELVQSKRRNDNCLEMGEMITGFSNQLQQTSPKKRVETAIHDGKRNEVVQRLIDCFSVQFNCYAEQLIGWIRDYFQLSGNL